MIDYKRKSDRIGQIPFHRLLNTCLVMRRRRPVRQTRRLVRFCRFTSVISFMRRKPDLKGRSRPWSRVFRPSDFSISPDSAEEMTFNRRV